MARRAWGRAMIAGALLLGCGTAPAEPADAEAFCADRELWICRRDQLAGRLDAATYEECLASIACEGAAWPPGCAPTEEQASACLELLMRDDLASTPSGELFATYDACELCP